MRSIRSVLHSLKPQKRVLIIGSAFVDMVINVQEMPRAGADVEGDYRCTTVGPQASSNSSVPSCFP